MGRRHFDFFYIELCCALEARVPRYPLWLELAERGADPEVLDCNSLLAFFDEHLDSFVAHCRFSFRGRARKRLRRQITQFDPSVSTPDEVFARLAAPGAA